MVFVVLRDGNMFNIQKNQFLLFCQYHYNSPNIRLEIMDSILAICIALAIVSILCFIGIFYSSNEYTPAFIAISTACIWSSITIYFTKCHGLDRIGGSSSPTGNVYETKVNEDDYFFDGMIGTMLEIRDDVLKETNEIRSKIKTVDTIQRPRTADLRRFISSFPNTSTFLKLAIRVIAIKWRQYKDLIYSSQKTNMLFDIEACIEAVLEKWRVMIIQRLVNSEEWESFMVSLRDQSNILKSRRLDANSVLVGRVEFTPLKKRLEGLLSFSPDRISAKHVLEIMKHIYKSSEYLSDNTEYIESNKNIVSTDKKVLGYAWNIYKLSYLVPYLISLREPFHQKLVAEYKARLPNIKVEDDEAKTNFIKTNMYNMFRESTQKSISPIVEYIATEIAKDYKQVDKKLNWKDYNLKHIRTITNKLNLHEPNTSFVVYSYLVRELEVLKSINKDISKESMKSILSLSGLEDAYEYTSPHQNPI